MKNYCVIFKIHPLWTLSRPQLLRAGVADWVPANMSAPVSTAKWPLGHQGHSGATGPMPHGMRDLVPQWLHILGLHWPQFPVAPNSWCLNSVCGRTVKPPLRGYWVRSEAEGQIHLTQLLLPRYAPATSAAHPTPCIPPAQLTGPTGHREAADLPDHSCSCGAWQQGHSHHVSTGVSHMPAGSRAALRDALAPQQKSTPSSQEKVQLP